MTKEEELATAKALTKYLIDENIDPESVDFIKIEEIGFNSIHMVVILKPLINIKYFGYILDILPNL
jgi:hypothetical protein